MTYDATDSDDDGVVEADVDNSSTTTEDAVVTREFNPGRTDSLHLISLPAPPAGHWDTNTSGSGFAGIEKPAQLLFGTGSTQGSLGEQWYEPGGDNDIGSAPADIADWSRDRTWRCEVGINDVGERVRFGMGLLRDTEPWVGFEFEGGSLNAVVNDGAAESNTEIDASPSTGNYDLRIEFVSGTRVEYYVGGTKQTEHTSNLPSGSSRSGMVFAGRAENPNSATDARASYRKTEVIIHA